MKPHKNQNRADRSLRKWILRFLKYNGGDAKATAEQMAKKYPDYTKAFFKGEIARLFKF